MSSRFDQRRKYTAVVKPRQRPPVGLRKDLLILFERGMRHQAQGKLDKALECYDAILKLEPNNTDALFMRARALMKAERYREAIDWAKRAAASKPNHPALQFIIAFNYHSLNRPFETIRHLKKALKLQPDYSMARLLLARS
jgi:tetratricopeptide (TPR) repeat protein